MTNTTKTRFGAGAALAIILSGVTALSKVAREPNAEQTAQLPQIRSADNAALISWLSRTTLPMLDDAQAIPNVQTRRIQYMPPLRVSATRPLAPLGSTCMPQWLPGPFGSERPQTPDLCRAKPLLPLPPLELKNTVPLTLPSLSTFNSVFENDRLNPTWLPNQSEREAKRILRSFERNANAQRSEMAMAKTARLPYMNPLGWSVPNNEV